MGTACRWCGGQKRVLDPLNLGLQVIMSCLGCMLVLYKISKCSYPLRYFSRPWGWAIKTSKSVLVTHFLQGGSTFEWFHNLLGEASHHLWDQVFNDLTLQGKVHMKSTEKGCQFCSKAEMVFQCPAWEWGLWRSITSVMYQHPAESHIPYRKYKNKMFHGVVVKMK